MYLLWSMLDTTAAAPHPHKEILVTNKPTISVPSKEAKIGHPGMMGDGTEEQNLNEPGDPSVRIKSDEVDAAFGKKDPKKP
jgi:hypothetical protein